MRHRKKNAIDGAAPGDVLRIEVLGLRLRVPYGVITNRHGFGALPGEYPRHDGPFWVFTEVDDGHGLLPFGAGRRARYPLGPFLGIMGVATDTGAMLSSTPPGPHGGNLDCQELGSGTTLYLPVFVPGALFSCGDGHGVQGDGEVCVTAIETALQGRFRLTLRKDLRLDYPRAETPDHYMTMAMDPDLDQCVVRALRDMIVLLGEKRNLSREDAYTLCSLAADLRVTQTVNGSKGIHCMIEKAIVHG